MNVNIVAMNNKKINKFSEDMQEMYYLLKNQKLDSNKPPKELCSAKAYLQYYILPILLPAINELLTHIQKNNILSKRRSRFNACDYISEYLYRNNPRYSNRADAFLEDIPFVQRIMLKNPRPPLPLSLVWSDEEAAIKIQSFWRGYAVRKLENVQELRNYQNEMRTVSCEILFPVQVYMKK
ncbi:IQ domain-containing protein K isoform X2 [Hydra vulgaris]|uniref:IQ domain-containing protein K isoform X2 n=1 Tax=Hydra vulgaris TaxID=6087 RepID=A0ABM4CC05_HYDVU